MITVSFVVKTLIVASIISLGVIIAYYFVLKRNSHDIPTGLINTDICISDGIEEIKIICK